MREGEREFVRRFKGEEEEEGRLEDEEDGKAREVWVVARVGVVAVDARGTGG